MSWTLTDIKLALIRRQRVLLIAFAALSAGALAAVLTAPTIYEGGFKVLVKRDRADAVVSPTPGSEPVQPELLSETELMSQVELIKARDLMERVATEAGLTQRLLASGAAETDAEALARATKALEEDLVVAPIRKTWLIDVTYEDRDPQVARNVLESLVRVYFEKHLALHRPSGTYEFFSAQADQARQEVEAAQQALLEYSAASGVVSASVEKQSALQKLAEFDALRAQTGAQLAEANGRLAALTAVTPGVPERRTAQVKVMENSGVAQDVQSRILTLEMKRTELLQRFTPEYRGVVEIDQQLADARAALNNALTRPLREETIADNPTRQWLETETARAQTDNAALQARLQALSMAVGRYRQQAQALEVQSVEQTELQRRVTNAEERYRLYLTKREEARISDELDKTRIANVAIAQAPALKPEPRRVPSLAMLPLMLGVSLILSLALALVVDAFSLPARSIAMIEPLPLPDGRYTLAHTTRVMNQNTASFSAQLDQLKTLTDSLQTKLAAKDAPVPQRQVEETERPSGWVPGPAAEGLRQGA